MLVVLHAIPVKGQENNLSRIISVDYKEQSLGSILEDLRKHQSLQLTYSSGQLNLKERLTLKMEKQPAKKVLEALCRLATLEYSVVGKQIILKPRKESEPDGKSGLNTPYQTIRGLVSDKISGVPLPGATVIVQSSGPATGVNTGEDGVFHLKSIPVGRHELTISLLGYETIRLPNVLLTSGKELYLYIELPELVSSLGAVTVNGNNTRRPLNEMAGVSARSFSVEETGRYAASVFDPARMVMNFAGITSSDDGSNEVIIRGNSPKGVQWRLEGIEIMNPNHFGEEGGSGGGISMISSGMLGTSDFLTGAFPAEYGNALSGIFDLRFRTGNTAKREYAIMAGALGTEASAEGPFRTCGKASYLVNYRYSTLSLLDKAGISPFGENGVPDYQDLAYNLNFPTAKAGTFSLFGIGGISSQNMIAVRDRKEWEEFADKFDRSFRYYSGSSGIKHLWLLNDRIYLKNIISWSGSRITDRSDTLNEEFNPGVYGRDAYVNTSLRYSAMINYKGNARNTIRAGMVSSRLGFNLNSLTYKKDIGRLSDFLVARGDAWNHQFYTQWKHEWPDRISMNAGIHLNYFTLSKTWSAEPRVGLSWWIKPGQRLSFGAGLHSRLEPLAYYYGRNEQADGSVIFSNSALSPTKAVHLVLGYEKLFKGDLRFRTEAYYQHLYKVPVSGDPAFNFSVLNVPDAYFIYSRNYHTLVNKGTGRNKGLDLSLEKSFSRQYYFLLTASLFDSRFRALPGTEFNTAFNSRYTTNLVAGKEWGTGPSGKNLLGLNARIMTHGGMRYSPVDLAASRAADDQVIDESRVNEMQVSPYFRADISFSYRVNRPGLTHAFFIDVQNVINRKNELTVFYNVDKNNIETIYQAGLIPSVYYRIEF
ncbi:TonB-dependent receptor-like protein [Anseongella ginsenosidimutans]|uniref:TonB-dependent receptor-like protein n=1 Tax=Anseongella ginsenosidimutans TaxID=496056 RepID=A0A4R3L1P2_9SPHI|nr:TonB-dependent receptor-like protein [Anseongella ginsenosidimutans]